MRFYIYVAVLFALGVSHAYMYWQGRMDAQTAYTIKQLKETQEDQEVLNEIRNNRPDSVGVVKRLREGSF